MIKWYRYLLKEQESNITFESGNLIELLKKYRKIKQLRVPSWCLQNIYHRPDLSDVACVALENGIPVEIAVIHQERYDYGFGGNEGVVHLFVDSWHRDLKLASKMFPRIMELSGFWKVFIAGRVTKLMFEKRGFKDLGHCYRYDGSYFLNPNYKEMNNDKAP